MTQPQVVFDRVWFWKQKLPERRGQLCRIVAAGRKNSALVEFADGFRVLTSRYAVRKAPPAGEGRG